jgi:hypothetical protein
MSEPLALASRRELMVDDHLLAACTGGLELRLQQPVAREVVLVTDQPWEGCMNNFNTLLRVGDRYRLYYRGWQVNLAAKESKAEAMVVPRPPCICVAESSDGIHWERPVLGLYDYQGRRDHNIVWMDDPQRKTGWHGFSPFLDTRPGVPADERFKAVGVLNGWPIPGLHLFTSPDGYRWRQVSDEPIFTAGKFDSQNTVQYDALRGEYRVYARDFRDGRREIRTATSPDLRQWSSAEWLEYGDAPPDQLYTNNVLPYHRAPHLFLGFPARYVERKWTPTMEQLPELAHRRLRSAVSPRYGTATSDAVFMSSRDGRTFRRWGEAFIRPGLRATGSWTYGDLYPVWGLAEAASDLPGGGTELSLYATEGYWRGESCAVRRYSLRLDGFVALHASRVGGELVTKPVTFTGERLSLNLSTSAAGSLRVELQDGDGQPLPGYALDDCWEIVGDTLDYTVTWREGASVAAHAGRPVRLRIVLHDADLYSLQFAPA